MDVSNSPTVQGRAHSGIPISALLLSPPTSPQIDQHFHELFSISAPLADATSFTPASSRPTSQQGSSTPSNRIHRLAVTPRSAETHSILTSEFITLDIDERLTWHYLDTYFDEVNPSMFGMLPRDDFIEWALGSKWKSIPDRVMFYALMSSATLHSTSPVAASHREMFRRIVYEELAWLSPQPCLQNVHTLLFLTLIEYGDHRYQAGNLAFARCVNIMDTLRLKADQLRIEEGGTYNFTVNIASECLRRTLGAIFCFDSHMQLGNPLLRQMAEYNDAAFTLPDTNEHCNVKWLLLQPVSKRGIGNQLPEASGGFGATDGEEHMIQITRIYADIGALIAQNEAACKKLNANLSDQLDRNYLLYRLRIWRDVYDCASPAEEVDLNWVKKRYGSTGQRYDRDQRSGGLNMLYHLCQMKLYRQIHHHHLTDSELSSHARHTTLHAIAVLRLAEQTMARDGHTMRDYRFATRNFSTVSAIIEAIDIVTAVGRVTDILEPGSRIMSLMYSALDLLHQLGSQWGLHYVKYDLVKRRIQMVYRAAEAALDSRGAFFYCSDPVDTSINKKFDLVYGPDRRNYIGLAYPDGAMIQDEDLYEIHTSRKDDEY